MNKQPYYHGGEVDGDPGGIIEAVKSVEAVIEDTVAFVNNELLFTATRDVSQTVERKLQDLGYALLTPIDAEPGDPNDLM